MKLQGDGITKENAKWYHKLLLYVGMRSDFIYNQIVGNTIFLFGGWKTVMFTARVKLLKEGTGWRAALANFLCSDVLNPVSQRYLKKPHC